MEICWCCGCGVTVEVEPRDNRGLRRNWEILRFGGPFLFALGFSTLDLDPEIWELGGCWTVSPHEAVAANEVHSTKSTDSKKQRNLWSWLIFYTN